MHCYCYYFDFVGAAIFFMGIYMFQSIIILVLLSLTLTWGSYNFILRLCRRTID